MSDFVLDFRKKGRRFLSGTVDSMRYYDDISVQVFEYEKFSLAISRADNIEIWGPYKPVNENIFIAISGRIALESIEWKKAEELIDDGGLACKAIYQKYKSGGIEKLKDLNGNFVVLVFDAEINKFYLIIDRCGMYACFGAKTQNNELVFSSHPDLLAKELGISREWDLISMSEFLITGKVSFSYSYYKKIQALDHGRIHIIDIKEDIFIYESNIKYFDFNFKIDHCLNEWGLAEELALAFRKAINRRILPIFGNTAIALSGGLDSRTVLCSAEDTENIVTFCFFDEENAEYKIAKNIANEMGVRLIPLKREFEFYGENAELGVKIQGGMGNIGANHFLGFRKLFKEIGIDNIITGFYCDYFFKGLAQDTLKRKIFKIERLSDFDYQWYERTFSFDTEYFDMVQNRLSSHFPMELRKDNSDIGRLMKERMRIFPLYYEPDNAETTIPQRVMGWYLPIVDNDIIEIYLKIPPEYKLNASMYSKMVKTQCGKRICNIKNINTGAKVNASLLNVAIHQAAKNMKKTLSYKRSSMATPESWPNWEYYILNSKIIDSLWSRKNDSAQDIFRMITGEDHLKKSPKDYKGIEVKLFFRLLTLKLWLDLHV